MKTLNKTALRLTVLLTALLCVTACGEGGAKTAVTDDGSIIVSNGSWQAGVTELKLADGTRCAALVGTHKGAITCDWK